MTEEMTAVDNCPAIGKTGETGASVMDERPVSRRILITLVVGLLLLPLAAWAVVAVAALLGAMGDSAGAVLLSRLAWLFGAAWIVDLVALVAGLAINALGEAEK
jgi:hypothetical protein